MVNVLGSKHLTWQRQRQRLAFKQLRGAVWWIGHYKQQELGVRRTGGIPYNWSMAVLKTNRIKSHEAYQRAAAWALSLGRTSQTVLGLET